MVVVVGAMAVTGVAMVVVGAAIVAAVDSAAVEHVVDWVEALAVDSVAVECEEVEEVDAAAVVDVEDVNVSECVKTVVLIE